MGTIWAISISVSNPQILQIDTTTGAILTQFTAPHPTVDKTFANGRAIAVDVANQLIYYGYSGSQGIADDPNIYLTNYSGVDLGVFLNVRPIIGSNTSTGLIFGGMNSLCFDNGTLWVTDATPTPFVNHYGYQFSISSKTLPKTVHGLYATQCYVNSLVSPIVVVNNSLDVNFGDGPIGLFNLSGTTLTTINSSFINPAGSGIGGIYTGVTFDGTHYIVSNPLTLNGGTTQRLLFFDSGGNFVSSLTLNAPGPQPVYGWFLNNIAAAPAPTPPVPSNLRIQIRGVKRWPVGTPGTG